MSTENRALNWIASAGWMVFAGPSDDPDEIRAQVLERAIAGDGIAYISFTHDQGDRLMDAFEDLGAMTGYFVDPVEDSPETMTRLLTDASVIVMEVGDEVDPLYFALVGVVATAIQTALERGAILLLEGLTGMLFGRWFLSDTGEIMDGLNWVKDVMLFPGVTSLQNAEIAKMMLVEQTHALAIGVGNNSALALGPGGQIEVWGEQNVTVSLGSDFSG